MNNKYGSKIYKAHDIEGAQPAEVIALLLKKGASHIQKAKQALLENKMETCYFYCEKTTTLVSSLRKSLYAETEEQQRLASTLKDYYAMLDRLMSQILSQRSVESCDALIDSLTTMGTTWCEVASRMTSSSNPLPEEGDSLELTHQTSRLSLSS